MTHSEGVPLTRELLEALRDFAVQTARMGSSLALGARQHGEKEALGNFNRATSAAATLKDACTAALASDAGTPEGEWVEGWTGKPCPCPNCGAIRNERDAHFCSSTRAASAPLDESGAAPTTNAPEISTSLVDAAPDAELDRLLWRLNGLEQDIGIADERGDTEAKAEHVDTAVGCMAAIHAHVERRVAEAVKEERLMQRGMFAAQRAWDMNHPAPGDASGETAADFESALDVYRDELMSNTRVGASGGLRALEPDRTELRRLYRAATGEVVGNGVCVDGLYSGCDTHRTIAVSLNEPVRDDLPGTPVWLVRRDKEGV